MTAAVELTNGVVDVTVSVAEGLRISRYGLTGSANLLASAGDRSTPTPYGPWKPLGGHRLWVAPESMPGSYAPDPLPIASETRDARSARFMQPPDRAGIEKGLSVAIAAAGTGVTVTHRIVNRTCWPIRVAPWAISIVPGDASAFIPQPPFRSHTDDFLPARTTVQWSYTDLTDPRWTIGPRLIRLTPDAASAGAQKLGVGNAAEWCAVQAGRTVFVKQFPWYKDAVYPDFGCNNELFTVADYLEVETLGPLQLLAPGGTAIHTEHWSLFDGPPASSSDAEQFERLEHLVKLSNAGHDEGNARG
jgi:hypothetical protein